ncbi:condensation domain-containing protein [Rhizobium leguminosarum]
MLLLLLAKTRRSNFNDKPLTRSRPRQQGKNWFPLTLNQEEFWFLKKLQPDCAALNISSAYMIEGPLDVRALERAVEAIIDRHENLRTIFDEVDGTPMQCVLPPSPFDLPIIAFEETQEDDRTERVVAILHQRSFEIFEFADGPPLRFLLVRLNENKHVLWWCLHHILVDAIGLSVLVRELCEFYSSFALGHTPDLPDRAAQCGDYAELQRSSYAPIRDSRIAYWRSQLLNYNPKLTLPADFPRPAIQTYAGSEIYLDIPNSIENRLESLGKEIGASLFMMYLSAFYVLAHRYTGEHDLVVGSPMSQRNAEELADMIADFSNMLLYRVVLDVEDSLLDVANKVKSVALAAYRHSEVPSQDLILTLTTNRDPAYSPLFQMMFVFQHQFPQNDPEMLRGLKVTPFNIERRSSQFDVSLFVFHDKNNGSRARFEYNSDLFKEETVRGVAADLMNILSLMGNCNNLSQYRLSDIEITRR